MSKRNPWADRWEFELGHRSYIGVAERQMMKREADDARSRSTFPCSEDGCDLTSFYRPAVTGWWCTDRHLNAMEGVIG